MAQITLNSSGVASNGSLLLQSNGTTTAVTIDTAQNVGVGVTPSAWASAYKAIQLTEGVAFSEGGGNTYLSNNWFNDGTNKYIANGAASSYGQSGGTHIWYNAASGTAGNTVSFTQAMTLNASGKLSIGTTEANRGLNVYEANATANSSTAFWNFDYAGIYLRNTSNVTNTLTGISFGGGSAGNSVSAVANILESTSLGALGFFTGGSGVSNTVPERARITSAGNLVVGDTSGSSRFKVVADGTNVNSEFYQPASTSYTSIIFTNPNGTVGSITTSGSSTSYATSSDYRLKNSIAPMTGALEKVLELNPVTYTWKVDGSAGEGFIAHELQAVVPDCVTGEKDAVDADGNPQYQGIDTSFLVATLTAAIQELKAIVDAQAVEIAALKGTA